MSGTRGGSGAKPGSPAPEREVRRLARRYGWWLAIYVAGFALLWVLGLAHTAAFSIWAIGRVLIWGLGVQRDYFRRYLRGNRPER